MSKFEKDKLYQSEKGLVTYREQIGDLHLVTRETVNQFGSETEMFYVKNVEEIKDPEPTIKDVLLG